MGKLEDLVGLKGRVLTKKGFMYWDSPDEINEVLRIETLNIPTLKGFRQKRVVVIQDSQGGLHDVAPHQIKGIE